MADMHRVFLSIGGNLGDRMANLEDARMFIGFNLGDIIQSSPVYETEPWQMQSTQPFLNQVVEIATTFSIEELIEEIKELEEFFERKRTPGVYLPRQMDVDVLFYDDVVMDEKSITIPHPRLHLRKFVLAPLCDIAPGLIHPAIQKSIAELLPECTDNSEIKKF